MSWSAWLGFQLTYPTVQVSSSCPLPPARVWHKYSQTLALAIALDCTECVVSIPLLVLWLKEKPNQLR